VVVSAYTKVDEAGTGCQDRLLTPFTG